MPRDLEFHGLMNPHGRTPLSEKTAGWTTPVLCFVVFFFFMAFVGWPVIFDAMDRQEAMEMHQ